MRFLVALVFILMIASCKKSGQIEDILPSKSISKDSFYFKAKLNGMPIFWKVPAHKNDQSFAYHAGASFGYSDLSANCIEGNCHYMTVTTQIFANNAQVRPQMNVGFNMAAPTRTHSEVLSWFSPGDKTYQIGVRNSSIADLLNPAKNGVIIYYIDENNKAWAANNGGQQGSWFQSLSVEDEKCDGVSTDKVWKARFSCKMYDASGNFITVEDGEIYGPLIFR